MRTLVPLTALILVLRLYGNMPDLAHFNFNVSQAEYVLRGWWPNWQMQMRMWHAQEYSLWGGVLFAALTTAHTLTRGK